MGLLIEFAVLIVSLAMLLWGANTFIDTAAAVARSMRISPFLIGIVLVGFGTSIPELSVAISASAMGASGIAIGNIVGSNIANIGLILAIAIMVSPIFIIKQDLEEGIIVLFVFLIAALYMFDGIGMFEGIILLGFLLVYIYDLLKYRKKPEKYLEIRPIKNITTEILLIGLSVITIFIGSRFIVDSAVNIARALGLTEVLIGITILAIGTSIPELITVFYAAKKKMRELALGTIFGSNLFNISAILGLSAIISPLPTTSKLIYLDLPVMILLLVMVLIFMRTGWRLGRREGIVLLLIYVVFIMLQVVKL